ncbi:hypothetical protein CEXT_373741 [Caerostris extrusa]|uniref:Uncharacterized protein n=1 Tax=Caerostris extrusa TaxID=172846 RepID=A0AAV4NZC5_CAEEX|nr:hypothetical protein CEXT_373741 [Caerostris extrusa]
MLVKTSYHDGLPCRSLTRVSQESFPQKKKKLKEAGTRPLDPSVQSPRLFKTRYTASAHKAQHKKAHRPIAIQTHTHRTCHSP